MDSLITDCVGIFIFWYNNIMSYIQSNAIVPLAIATTLTAADSGKIFMVDKTGAFTITLPAVATSSGVTYKFIVSTAAVTTTRIAATAGTPIVGHALNGPRAATNPSIVVGAGTIAVNFSTSCVLGDTINLYCNGVGWFAEGFTGSNTLATGITFTA